jgi:hypothetical protein
VKRGAKRFFRRLGRWLWGNRGEILRSASDLARDPQRAERLDQAADILDPHEQALRDEYGVPPDAPRGRR